MYRTVKVKIQRQGSLKAVSENYLVESVSPSDADTKFNEYIKTHSFSDLLVRDTVVTKVNAILNKDIEMEVENWYKASCKIITTVERKIPKKKGGGYKTIHKKESYILYIKDSTLEGARNIAEKHLTEDAYGNDFEIVNIGSANIMDIIN